MKKRIWAVFFVLALAIVTVPAAVQAGPYDYYDDVVSWPVEGGNIYIRHGEVVGCDDYVTEAFIPDHVEGQTVTRIGDHAFISGMIRRIVIPSSVNDIDEGAFDNCSNLTSIEVDARNEEYSSEDGVLFNKDKTILIRFPERYGEWQGFYDEQSYTIPDSVIEIGENAFSYCEYLSNVEFPSSLRIIGSNAFGWCHNLTSIEIPDSVMEIKSNAFLGTEYYHNDSNWENGVLYIGNHLIEAKETLSGTYQIKAGTVTLAEDAFYRCSITGVEIPDSVTSIGKDAFLRCTGLRSIIIPDSVTHIGWRAFSECTGLGSINIPNGVTRIEGLTFEGCTGLTDIEIPNSVTSIGYSAFENCTGLTSIEIPNSVTSIGHSAFEGCTGLTSIEIPNSVTDIGYGAFAGCTGLTSINVASGNESYSSVDGVLFNSNKTELICYPAERANMNYIIPDGVKSIETQAFYGCTGLRGIEIPDSVEYIGYYAFAGCTGLTSIEIPNSVTDISSSAFSDCIELRDVKISNSVAYINSDTFYGCTGLASIEIPDSVEYIGYQAFEGCTGLTSIEIPDSVTDISSSAFEGCTGLTSVTIGNGVTTIGWDAFSGCSGIKDVYYNGSQEKWEEIYIDDYNNGNNTLLNATIHFNGSGSVADYLVGDVNNDGTVNAKDKTILNRYLAGWEGYETMILNWTAADVNKDGEVNAKDKTILNRYLAGWEGYDSYFAS